MTAATKVTRDRERFERPVIGCSAMSTIVGVNPYGSLTALYAELKYGVRPARSAEAIEAMDWGTRLEVPVFEGWCSREGIDPSGWVHDESHFLERDGWPQRVTPDFLRGRRNVQIKCVNAIRFAREGWDAEVPLTLVAQEVAEVEAMLSAPHEWHAQGVEPEHIKGVDVVVLVGGNKLRHFYVPYDPELGGLQRDAAARFWRDHIVAGKCPPADPNDACADAAVRLYPRASRALRDATAAEAEVLRELVRVRDEAKRIEDEKKRLENEVRLLIADSRGVELPGLRATWSEIEGRTDWKRAAEEIARRAGVDVDALVREFRGSPSRRLEVRTA